MPCRESIFYSGNLFHIFCRGNEKRDIFLEEDDYNRFLTRMKEYKIIHKISIICYCLMPNHFHLVLRQNTNKPLSLFIHRLAVSYSMYFNKRYNRVGHLFQGRFKAKLITKDQYLLHLSWYIHINPLKIKNSMPEVENYPWSSLPEYIGIRNEQICDKEIILKQFNDSGHSRAYREFINNFIPYESLKEISDIIIEPE